MMVRDGVTSAFELEVGTGDVDAWYAARDGGQIVNHGVAVGHIPARMKVLGDPGTGLLPAGVGASGQDVTTEAYPYGAGMTEIQSALYDDWRSWPDERFGQNQLVSTGERLTRATFEQARKTGGTVITHGRPEEQTRAAIASPLAMIASDGFIENGRGHPRTSGTYAKVLGRYVRDERAIPLMDALRRMTLEPARRLERRAPAMAAKGRVRVGADADLTIFDPATVIDRATYEDASIPSAGIPFVVVGGQVVVDGGEISDARPGRGIRAPR